MIKYILSGVSLLFVTLSFSQSKPVYRIDVHENNESIGVIDIELFPGLTPLHVAYFDSVVTNNQYDSTAFHRVISGFVIQGGDPNSISGPDSTWGMGDPSQPTVEAEFNMVPYIRGVLGAARDEDPNSASSQFFICHDDANFLTNNYTAYGRVIEGLNIVDTIASRPTDANDKPYDKIIMFVDYVEDIASTLSPTVLITEDSLTNTNIHMNLEWEINEDALFYEIEVTQTEDFSVIDYVRTASDGDMLFPNLEIGGVRYYWRVRAYDGATTTLSEVRTFTTKYPAGIPPLEHEAILFYDAEMQILQLKHLESIQQIEVLDITGKLIARHTISETEMQISFPKHGMYFVRLRGEGIEMTKKVIAN